MVRMKKKTNFIVRNMKMRKFSLGNIMCLMLVVISALFEINLKRNKRQEKYISAFYTNIKVTPLNYVFTVTIYRC